MTVKIYNPSTLHSPSAPYRQAARVKANELLFVAGQLPNDRQGKLVGAGDFDAQARQVYANIGAALADAGGSYANIVQFTSFLVDESHIPNFFRIRNELFPTFFKDGNFPPNTLLVIKGLARPEYFLEIQTIAAL